MALIICPECGREVSDKAPICPHCGIEIAGKYRAETPKAEAVSPAETKPSSWTPQTPSEEEEPKRNTLLYIVIAIAVVLLAAGAWLYKSYVDKGNESDAYAYAMQSDNAHVLQQYLDEYTDAPQEHRDSIQFHLTQLVEMEKEWHDALVSNSRIALQNYLDMHQDSPYKKTCLHLLDSIDWASASSANTALAFKDYLQEHPNGEHCEEANENIRTLNAKTLQPEEQQMIVSVFRNFFQAINSKDEDRLTSTVTPLIKTFLGKSDATKSDVITFMKKLWKADVINLNWKLQDDFEILKKEIGDNEYEYSVDFSAIQEVERESGITSQRYHIKSKMTPDGKITEYNMSKIISE